MSEDGAASSLNPTDLLFVVARGMVDPRLNVMPPAVRQLWAAHDASRPCRVCDCQLVITTRTCAGDGRMPPTISVGYELVRSACPTSNDKAVRSYRVSDLDELRTLTASQLETYVAARRARARHGDAVSVARAIDL